MVAPARVADNAFAARFAPAADDTASRRKNLSFDERFSSSSNYSFFNDRFVVASDSSARAGATRTAAAAPTRGLTAPPSQASNKASSQSYQLASASSTVLPRPAATATRSLMRVPAATPSPLAEAPAKPVRTAALAYADATASVDDDGNDTHAATADMSHTAIYDIEAHMVYLPNGDRLEAHSGLGSRMDDVHYITDKNLGPTPPNVYSLSLREQIFHGVRALRLNPVGNGNMHGRDGILAHSYMLGPNGQSNGCVSFNDYSKFLNAYLRGDVERLVVVEHLANAPKSSDTAFGGSLPEAIKRLFIQS